NKLIRRFDVTDASVHDSNVFEQILDADNSRADVWVDSAYRSKEKEESLSELGYRSQVHRKGQRGTPLSDRSKKAIRSIGIIRARTDIGLMNIVYNMRRFCFLQRMRAP
ncbi:MAG: transposase, partial [Cycloclasticus sp.]|nr:transposase [Cycloclasticus sp.]